MCRRPQAHTKAAIDLTLSPNAPLLWLPPQLYYPDCTTSHYPSVAPSTNYHSFLVVCSQVGGCWPSASLTIKLGATSPYGCGNHINYTAQPAVVTGNNNGLHVLTIFCKCLELMCKMYAAQGSLLNIAMFDLQCAIRMHKLWFIQANACSPHLRCSVCATWVLQSLQ